jgi:hypothetical protein
MQWIRFNRDDEFDYEVVSNEQFYLDGVIKEKKEKGVTIVSDEIINESVILEFSDGDVYSWCDEIFANIKNLDN